MKLKDKAEEGFNKYWETPEATILVKPSITREMARIIYLGGYVNGVSDAIDGIPNK